jgi:hypothetical protein
MTPKHFLAIDSFLYDLPKVNYRLVWAEAKGDARSVILDLKYYFRIFLQRDPQTNPYHLLELISFPQVFWLPFRSDF